MEFYFAPMEGIPPVTHTEICIIDSSAGWKKYYTPFLSPSAENGLSTRELKDVLPENNEEVRPVPQLLVNHPEGFLKGGQAFAGSGIPGDQSESGLSVGDGDGQEEGLGALMYPEELDALLDKGSFSIPWWRAERSWCL